MLKKNITHPKAAKLATLCTFAALIVPDMASRRNFREITRLNTFWNTLSYIILSKSLRKRCKSLHFNMCCVNFLTN